VFGNMWKISKKKQKKGEQKPSLIYYIISNNPNAFNTLSG